MNTNTESPRAITRAAAIPIIVVVIAALSAAYFASFSATTTTTTTQPLLKIQQYSAVEVSRSTLQAVQSTPYVTRFPLPSKDSGPSSIVADNEGKVWIVESGDPRFRQNVSVLAVFAPSTNLLVEYRIPDMSRFPSVFSMSVSADGKIWFTEIFSNSIWSFDPRTLKFTRYLVPTAASGPLYLAFDKAGKLWFSETFQNKIGVLEPSTGSIEEFVIPDTPFGPIGLTFDAQGNLWTVGSESRKILLFDPSSKDFAQFELPRPVFIPTGIVVDDEGGVWFTQHGPTSTVSRFFPTNGTMIDYVTSGTPLANQTLPFWIFRDNRGNIWFNEHTGNKIAKVDPSTGTLVEYVLPWHRISDTVSFSLDSRGNAWFVEFTENRFGVVDTSVVAPFELSTDKRALTLEQGSEATLTFTLSASKASEIRFGVTASTTPPGKLFGITAQFSPPEFVLVEGSEGRVSLKLVADSTLKPGNYTLTVTASDGSLSQSLIIELIVKARS